MQRSLPRPGTISVSASNVAQAVISNVVVLSYGCQYQGGFLYAVDDTTNNGVTGACTSTAPCTGSIGGKVASLVDQAEPQTLYGNEFTSIIWSSNGNDPGSSDYDYTAILGIDETSTPSEPSPTSPPYPPQTPAYTPCNGRSDGACNSSNILSYYNTYIGSQPGQTPLGFYAAGLCAEQPINGYSDWYLPSICEMDSLDNRDICGQATQSMIEGLSFLIGDPDIENPSFSCNPPSDTDCLAGAYWSSTEFSYNPIEKAFMENFKSNSSNNSTDDKSNKYGVRCSRALSF